MALSSPDSRLLSEIREETLSVLASAIGSVRHVALLDTPKHRNLGDSLIWRGTLDYLESMGVGILHHSDMSRYRLEDLRRLPPETPILLQGGGNWGDLYTEHDDFRRYIIKEFPRRHFILLPQSVFFLDPSRERRVLAEYAKRENVTYLLRDLRSLELVKRVMPDADVRFCHDLALGARIEDVPTKSGGGLLVLRRADGEVHPRDIFEGAGAWVTSDWSYAPLNSVAYTAAILVRAAYKRLPSAFRNFNCLERAHMSANSSLLSLNIRALLRQFASADAFATNRLHAHVSGILLGKPHWVADNSYGKISDIFYGYTGRFSTAHLTASMAEAVEEARSFVRGRVR